MRGVRVCVSVHVCAYVYVSVPGLSRLGTDEVSYRTLGLWNVCVGGWEWMRTRA